MNSSHTLFPNKGVLERLRQNYPEGSRVEVLDFSDPYSKITVGTRGTVKFIDDSGTLFCAFDNGEHLGLLYGIDHYRKVPSLSKKAIEGLLAVRESGRTNIRDLKTVAIIANELGHHEAALAINENKSLVANFIITGQTEEGQK